MTNTEENWATIIKNLLSIAFLLIGFLIGVFLASVIKTGITHITTEQYQSGYEQGYAEAKQMEGGKAYEAYVQNLADLCRRTTGEKVEGESDFFKQYLNYIVINKMESWSITCTKNN